MDKELVLDATVKAWRRTSHVYGQSDCLLSVAAYAGRLAGKDIGAPWRGTYSTETDALKIVAEAGGAVCLLGGALERGGLHRAPEPRRGDALVVEFGGLQFGALHLGNRVAMRLARGCVECRLRDVDILGAWRV